MTPCRSHNFLFVFDFRKCTPLTCYSLRASNATAFRWFMFFRNLPQVITSGTSFTNKWVYTSTLSKYMNISNWFWLHFVHSDSNDEEGFLWHLRETINCSSNAFSWIIQNFPFWLQAKKLCNGFSFYACIAISKSISKSNLSNWRQSYSIVF